MIFKESHFAARISCFRVDDPHFHAEGELKVEGGIQFKAYKLIYTGSRASKDQGRMCPEAEFLVGAGVWVSCRFGGVFLDLGNHYLVN